MNTRSKHNVYIFVAFMSAFLSPPLVRAAVPDIDITYNVQDALRGLMKVEIERTRDLGDDLFRGLDIEHHFAAEQSWR